MAATTNARLQGLVQNNPEAAANFIIQLLAEVVVDDFSVVDSVIACLPQKDRAWAYSATRIVSSEN